MKLEAQEASGNADRNGSLIAVSVADFTLGGALVNGREEHFATEENTG